MAKYPIHTIISAPEHSKPGLEQLQKAFGVIPNIAGVIANSPKLINSLVGVFAQVHSSSFTEQEIQTVLLTDAVANSSTYAVAFHTGLAIQAGVSSGDQRHKRRVFDVKMEAVVPPSGPLQNVENGFHAATSARSSSLARSVVSVFSSKVSPRMQSAARCAFAAA